MQKQDLPKLHELVCRAKRNSFVGKLLSVDPGETTGISILECTTNSTHLIHQEQLTTWPLEQGSPNLMKLFQTYLPTFMIFESYHIYRWRLQEHSFSQVPTTQIIGCLKTWAIHFGVKYREQTAQAGKGFFTDHRLKTFGLYFEGQPHARDSLKHAAQFLVFGVNK